MSKITFPTYLTIIRIVLMVPLVLVFSIQEIWAAYVVLVVFAVAAITDFLDGRLARSRGLVTDVGKFLDPLADKILVNGTLVCLCVYDEIIPVVAIVLILFRDFAVDGIRMIAAKHQEAIAASIWGKAKTCTQMIAIVILLAARVFVVGGFVGAQMVYSIGIIIFWLSMVLLVVSGTQYIMEGWKRFL